MAAIRPLVLTMVFCGLGVFTSCSDSDNSNSDPPSEVADYTMIIFRIFAP